MFLFHKKSMIYSPCDGTFKPLSEVKDEVFSKELMGKGFAVVADEVGNLAQKSAKAAKNTGELIEETKDAVERGARITRETGESLSTVVERAGKINDMIFEITKETERESQNVGQLTKGMEQISSVVQTNSATAEESAASSEELSAQASLLDKLVSKFRLQE